MAAIGPTLAITQADITNFHDLIAPDLLVALPLRKWRCIAFCHDASYICPYLVTLPFSSHQFSNRDRPLRISGGAAAGHKDDDLIEVLDLRQEEVDQFRLVIAMQDIGIIDEKIRAPVSRARAYWKANPTRYFADFVNVT